MAFPNNEINNFVLGNEDGCVYSGCRHGTRSGIGELYEKHMGPVTGISTHYNQSSPDFGHLFLTSSIDWTIKLWSLKVGTVTAPCTMCRRSNRGFSSRKTNRFIRLRTTQTM